MAHQFLKRWILAAVLALATVAQAAVPSTVGFQGFLATPAGAPVNGTVSMQFRLFDTATGGTAAWIEMQSVSVASGIFNVVLGAVTPIDITFDKPYWLEMQVGADQPMTPRQALQGVPFALSLRLPGCSVGDFIQCYTGAPGTMGVGACRGGTRTCQASTLTYGACTDQVVPVAETADGVDNDCDGMIDEGFAVLTVSKSGAGSGSVTSSPAGINCGSDCTEAYPTGTPILLTATPTGGSTFGNWSGGVCLGSGSCMFTMGSPVTVTATFNAAVPPTISNVTSSLPDGLYSIGTTMPVDVTFSAPVFVTSTPYIVLNSGGGSAVANYGSGHGSSVLRFNYTVAAGHNSADLDYTSSSALVLNGGTIRDANYNANLTLPAPGGPGSLGFNKNIVIDTTGPVVVQVTSPTPDGTYGLGNLVVVQIVFNEVVMVSDTPMLDLNTGASASYVSGTGTNVLTFHYTVGGGQSSADLDYVSALAFTGFIYDPTGNNASRTLPPPGASGSLGINKNIVISSP